MRPCRRWMAPLSRSRCRQASPSSPRTTSTAPGPARSTSPSAELCGAGGQAGPTRPHRNSTGGPCRRRPSSRLTGSSSCARGHHRAARVLSDLVPDSPTFQALLPHHTERNHHERHRRIPADARRKSGARPRGPGGTPCRCPAARRQQRRGADRSAGTDLRGARRRRALRAPRRGRDQPRDTAAGRERRPGRADPLQRRRRGRGPHRDRPAPAFAGREDHHGERGPGGPPRCRLRRACGQGLVRSDSRRLVAGLDLGSTAVKALVMDEDGTQLLVRQRPTPWRDGPGGTTELDAGGLIAQLRRLLHEGADQLRTQFSVGGAAVEAMAISGMGETGFLVDAHGGAAAQGIAWFDPRGQGELDTAPPRLRSEFAGRTGLPLGAQVSVAKLLHLRDGGLELRKLRWLNLPEFVAAAMGGRQVSEYPLASRTGLLDQDTGQPWEEMLDYLAVGAEFLPPLVDAGTALGEASADWLPPAFAGARLTVAGHDHLVSAVAGGAIPEDRYHVSMGTAEVLLRVLDEPLPFEAREFLARCLINSVRHVVPGRRVVVAGVKTGLLMRRALQLCG